MATPKDKQAKLSQAETMYLKGYTQTEIAEMLSVNIKTITAWKQKFQWEEKAKNDSITLKNVLRKLTKRLQIEMEKGETPESIEKGESFNADNVSKITSSIAKLADKKVLAFQAMQVMEEFQEFLIRNNQGDFLKQIAMLMPDFIEYMMSKEKD